MKLDKEIKRFFSTKYKFYKERKYSNGNILMVDRERIDASIINSLISLAISKKNKKNVIILSDLNSDHLNIKIYKHLGFENFIKGANKTQYLKNYYLFISSLLISTIGIFDILHKGFFWFIKNYKIRDIPFGDLIYDTNIRFAHRYMNLKIDYNFIKLLITSTFRILLIMKYFNEHKIKKVVVGTENYSFNSGIALRISTFRNIKNYYPGRIGDKEVEIATDNKKTLFLGRDNIKNYFIKKKFLRFNPKQNEINNFYTSRKNQTFKKFFWTLDNFKTANQQSKIGLNFLKKISKINKKKILFASHAFSDAAHQKGFIYSFKDFYDQFISTLTFVNKNDNENLWIFRPHPSSKIWNEEKYFYNGILRYRKGNIIVCPKNVPMKKLYEICDVVVTGSGTAGLEFICEGKQAILAGSAAYTDDKITPYYAQNKEQYFKFLKNIKFVKKSDEKQKNFAKKILYFFESGKFISKKISSYLINEDKISKKFFFNNFGMGFNQKNYFNLVHNMLKKDINKSKVFKKIIDLV